ncbi:hypothetical protein TWF506_011311 [Arthrobotrys conoides]|uniref:Uncharacterized protein n=1 Tax=Arthrobotrys conoides TaxID=74498 RepID=A0AAN8RRZ5_9PEZI
MADFYIPQSYLETRVSAIRSFFALPESVADNTDYISFDTINAADGHAIRAAFDNDPLFGAARARFTYDPVFTQIRIKRGSPLIDVTAKWFQQQQDVWVATGAVPANYYEEILSFGGLELTVFAVPHTIATPGLCLQPWAKPFPSVIVETGFTESLIDLDRDKEIWKTSTHGGTRVVIITKFEVTHRGTVMGDVYFHRLNGIGGISTHSKCTLFPAPYSDQQEVFFISLGEVYSGSCPEGGNPDTPLQLNITELRQMCREELRNNDLVPDSDDRLAASGSL